MTIGYECTVDLSEYDYLTDDERDNLLRTLLQADIDYAVDKSLIHIGGEVEVDSDYVSAGDVKSDIAWTLWEVAGIDADVDVWEVDCEPDWDKMPGGYDFLYN